MRPFLLAKRFIAGNRLEDAIALARSYEVNNTKSTLDHLGEDVTSRAEANKATRTYIRILSEISKKNLKSNIAVKLSQIGLAINKDLATKNLRLILKEAKRLKLIVEIDIEGSRYVRDTIDIYLALVKTYPTTIQAVQAYLMRTGHDLERILRKGGRIRLVKGAYKESEEIAHQDMNIVVRNFLKLLKTSLKKGKFVAIATHDERIIRAAKRFVSKNRIPKTRYEFEMLNGVRRDLQSQLASQGHPVRIYIPYGNQWLPYFYRRIMERKENMAFAIRSILGK